LWAIIVTGAFLRILQIGSKSLWLDEAFSVWMAEQPAPEMLSWIVRIDQHPPLYYLLLRFWMCIGDDIVTVRAFSALASTLTIPVIYALGRRLFGAKVGLLAATILALSPFHVRFAQEARMYALLALNASLALWALARLLTDPRAASVPLGQQLICFWRTERAMSMRVGPVSVPDVLRAVETDLAWGAYIFFTAATVWTHNTAVFFLIAANLFVGGLMWVRVRWPGRKGQLQPPFLKNWMLAQTGVFLLWVPWLKPFVAQAVGVYEEFWLPSPTWKTVSVTIRDFLCAFLPERIFWASVIWAMYGAILIGGILHLRKRSMRLALLLTAFLTPLVGEWLVSLRRPIFYDRTLIWASIPLYLLLAVGIAQLRYRSYILTVVTIIVTMNGLGIREYWEHFEKEAWDDAALYVAQRAERGDLILFHATWVQIPFDFYFRELNQSVTERGVPVDLFERGILEPKMRVDDLPRLRALIRERDRVWLIYSHEWYTDPQGMIPATLQQELKLLDRRRFYGLQVRLYGRAP
jgi:uncharacterized membrane protein